MSIETIYENCNQKKKDKVNVFVAQPKWTLDDWDAPNDLFFPKNTQKQIDYINEYLKKSLELNSDIVVFPELSILEDHLILIEEWAKTNRKIVIAGSQYYIDSDNLKMNITPIYINDKCFKKEKTIPAALEKSVYAKEKLKVGNSVYKFNNTICGTLCILICAEYLDSEIRHEVLKDHDIDVLVIVALHKGSESKYYNRMNLTIEESKNGIYVIYANNFIESFSDGISSIFGLVDKAHTRTSNYSHPFQVYKLEDTNNYFLAELDMKNKRSPVAKNTNTNPIINVKDGFIDINSNQASDSSFSNVCLNYNQKKMDHIINFTMQEKFEHIIESLHKNVEHNIIKLEFELNRNNPENLIDMYITQAIKEILFEIKEIYSYISGDVSVHIKLKETINDKSFLRTLYREPSNRDQGTGEFFEIFNHSNIPILRNTKLKHTVINNTQVRVNSAYNEVLNNPTTSWLCNDLIKAKEENLYYSTSFDWEAHYSSLAIFPIANKFAYIDEKKNMKGLLIIDSKNTECFRPETTNQIGGLLAHSTVIQV